MKILKTILLINFLFIFLTNNIYAACDDITTPRLVPSSSDTIQHDVVADFCTHSYGGEGCGLETAIGCMPVETFPMAIFLLTWAFGIGGGFAFLLLAYGGFKYVTSSGDPKKVQSAKETLMAAISGILFLVFSMFILRIIGVEIFKLPGFG